VPRKNGFGSNDLRDLGERFPPQPFGCLGQGDTLRIGEPDSAFDLAFDLLFAEGQRRIRTARPAM
jgi:hypothetical protein